MGGRDIKKEGDMVDVAQWVKKLAAKPSDLNSIPGNHLLRVGNQFLKAVL